MARPKSSGLASLRTLLDSYRKAQSRLESRVAQIGRDIESVESELRAFDGGQARRQRASAGGNGRRARRGGRSAAKQRARTRGRNATRGTRGEGLASIMVKILGSAGKPMGIPEIAAAAKKRGYRSSSPAFQRIVGMRLSTNKRFKRASFGKYQLSK